MSQAQDTREVKAARNQLMFRSVNEQIMELGERVGGAVAELDLACECDDTACTQAIKMPLEEFMRLDGSTNRFVVVAGHEDVAVEGVVDTYGRYVIVAKRGAGAEYVREHS
jgi:hypothetical protein